MQPNWNKNPIEVKRPGKTAGINSTWKKQPNRISQMLPTRASKQSINGTDLQYWYEFHVRKTQPVHFNNNTNAGKQQSTNGAN